MIDSWARRAWSVWARLTRRGERNRRDLYGGAFGLRMVTLHDTPSEDMDRFRRLVDACLERHAIAGPESVVALSEGRYEPGDADRLLFTFDDGMRNNYDAALHLQEKGVRAIFFVVPSFIGRTVREFVEFHRASGVEAFDLRPDTELSGLSPSEVREMAAMGHMIAGHNFAHRDLGSLSRVEDLDYEIGRALDTLSEVLRAPCEDFAFGFGRPNYLSAEAADYLNRRCRRVYACVRGLNVPGRTPRYFLRDHVDLSFPPGFVRGCLDGSLDHRARPEWEPLVRMGGLLPARRPDVRI